MGMHPNWGTIMQRFGSRKSSGMFEESEPSGVYRAGCWEEAHVAG